MKKILLIWAILLIGGIANAQQLFVEKIALDELKIIAVNSVAKDDTIALAGTLPYANDAKVAFWTRNGETIVPLGLENSGSLLKRIWPIYFDNTWWVGGRFANTNCKYLATLANLEATWQPFEVDSFVNGLLTYKDELIIYGDFLVAGENTVNHIFSINTEGTITGLNGGRGEGVYSAAIVGGELYVAQGTPMYPFINQSLWKYNFSSEAWVKIELGETYKISEIYLSPSPGGEKLEIGGYFVDELFNVNAQIIEYDPATGNILKRADNGGYIQNWGEYMFFFGTGNCDLDYFDQNNVMYAYDDAGCVGISDGGTTFLGHYAMPGSIEGDGYSDIYLFDTIPFTIFTGVEDIVSGESTLVAYPNPATNSLTVEFPDRVKDFLIYNTICQLVSVPTVQLGSNKVILDVSTLPKGIYTIVTERDGIARFVKAD